MSEKKKILVIDEDQTVCDMIAGTFKYTGLDVYTETQYLKGIDRAGEILPDLIFVSLLFNATNGLKVSRKIHSTEMLKKVPIVMLTSGKGELDPKYTRTIGVVDVLVKPLSERDLIAKTEDILGIIASRISTDEVLQGNLMGEEVRPAAVPNEKSGVESGDEGEDAEQNGPGKENVPFYEYGFNPEMDDLSEETADEEKAPELIREEPYGSDYYGMDKSGSVKKTKLIAAILALIAVLGAGIYFGYIFFSGNDKPELASDRIIAKPAQISGNLRQKGDEPLTGEPLREISDQEDEMPASPASGQKEAGDAVAEGKAYAGELAKGRFSTQVGFYGYRRNAEVLVEKMKQKGYAAFIVSAGAGDGKISYRVLVGSFDTRKEALKQAEAIFRHEGIKAVPFQE